VPLVRKAPRLFKTVVDSRPGRWVINGLFKAWYSRSPDKRGEIDKYIAFLKIGTDATQMEIFEAAYEVGKAIDPNIRLVGLTMDMDYMDSQPSKKQISFVTQLEEVKLIKRYYPKNFFPFLGIDPRHKAGVDLVNWAKPYFQSGVVRDNVVYPYFCGLKLYPALGFFPFDLRLMELYAYAEENGLPVMSHCTRVGSQYIGDFIESLIPDEPAMIGSANGNAAIDAMQSSVVGRIAAYKQRAWVKSNRQGKNDLACDLFSHPENYIPLLEVFPKLKLCLAHMGGSSEVIGSTSGDLREIRQVDPLSWFRHIEAMMKKYPNLYTDISYTLSDFKDHKGSVLQAVNSLLNAKDDQGELLGQRVLFGTDFFMTEQENRESELYAMTNKNLAAWWDIIGRVNTQKFLMQPV